MVVVAPAQAEEARAPTTIIVTAPSEIHELDAVPLSTAYSVSAITSQVLQNQSVHESLQTMLAGQPSVFAFQNGPNGAGANIFFRAFNAGQFAETFDGVSLNDIFSGAVNGQASAWNSVLVTPANVDSVVLNRGINDPEVNSYNSLGGTINFLPKLPSASSGLSFGSSYGSFNSYSVRGSINTGAIGGVKQLLQADYRRSDGWNPHTENSNLNLYYAGRHDAANGSVINLIGVFDINKGRMPFDMPVPLLQDKGGFYQYPPTVAYQAARNTQQMMMLDYKAILSPNLVFDNKVFGRGQDFLSTSYANPTNANSPYQLPNQPADFHFWTSNPDGPTYNPEAEFGSNRAGNAYQFYGYTTWTAGLSSKLTLSLPSHTLTLGSNFTYGEMHSRTYWYGSAPVPQMLGYNDAWDEHDSRLLISAYVQDKVKLLNDSITVTPGVKYIFAKTIDSDAVGFFYPSRGSDGDTETFLAPTIGLHFALSSKMALNAAFGRNLKLPDISAYYMQIPRTPSATPPPITIKPEYVDDFELGARYKDGDFTASLVLYREDFSRIFVDFLNPVTNMTNVLNGGSARYQGIEFQVAGSMHLEHVGALQGYMNLSLNDARYTSNFVADSVGGNLSNAHYAVTAGERMADVPNLLIAVGGTWSNVGYQLDVWGRYIGSQLTLNKQSGAPSDILIPSYAVFDVGISKTLALDHGVRAGQSIKVSCYVNNLFNRYYFNEAYVKANLPYVGDTQFAAPGAPRSIIAKIDFSF